jgi:hypothetical protein
MAQSCENTAGVLVFCRSIIGVWNTVDDFLPVITAALTRAARDADEAGGLRERAADLLRQLTEARDGPRGSSHLQRPNETPAESLAMERRRASLGQVIGIYYHWRDIGAEYWQKMFQDLKVHRVHMSISTSKLTFGVSLPDIRHTAVMTPPDDAWTLAQMMGRAARGGFGFSLLLRVDPPDLASLAMATDEIPAARLTNMAYWRLLKKSAVTSSDDRSAATRWAFTRERWVDFFVDNPIHSVPTDDLARAVEEAMVGAVDQGRLRHIGSRGAVTLSLTVASASVPEWDPSVIGLPSNIIRRTLANVTTSIYPLFPWIPALLYGTAIRTEIPRVVGPPGTRGIMGLLHPRLAELRVGDITTSLRGQIILLLQDIPGGPFEDGRYGRLFLRRS